MSRRRTRAGGGGGDGDGGMVTAEAAVALPALLTVLALAVWVLGAALAQVRCVDAAREGARAAARGEAPAVVVATARRVAPAGARVRIVTGAGLVTVRVSATVRPLRSVSSGLPALAVGGAATAADERLVGAGP